jgi:hypothetical protein
MYLDEDNYRIARREYKNFVNTYHEDVSFDYFVDCIYISIEEKQFRKEIKKCKKDEDVFENNDCYSYRGFFDSVKIVDNPEDVRLAENIRYRIIS